MAAAIVCKKCSFDLSLLPVSLRIEAIDEGIKNLSCPACGSSVVLRVDQHGVVVRGSKADTRYERWEDGAREQVSHQLSVGRRLRLVFTELGTRQVSSICYPKVPVFVDERGELVVPTLPVRTEELDCIDLERLDQLIASQELKLPSGGNYLYRLPLRGRDTLAEITIPTYTPEPGQPSKDNAFRGVNLRVWPNLDLDSWRYYLVGVAGSSDEGNQLVREQRLTVQVQGAEDAVWRPVDRVQRGGESRSLQLDQRPRWVAAELADTSVPTSRGGGRVLAGGLFYVPPARSPASDVQSSFGLDFGTSNTCVAVQGFMSKGQAQPELLPDIAETAWNHYLVRGGPESTEQAGPELWPSPRGFGTRRDLFASELLFALPKRDLSGRLADLASWRFGIDFGIPSAGAKPLYSEDEHILGDFKWSAMLRHHAAMFAPNVVDLQAHYLGAVLLLAYVRSAMGSSGRCSRVANVLYSYPMAFDADNSSNMKTLQDSTAKAQEWLAKATGLHWTLSQGADESTAAARNVGNPGANILVYLDMGGGSTDIGVLFEDQPNHWRTVYLTSVAYAGMALLEGFVGPVQNGVARQSCLAGNVSLDTLRRRVRESSDAGQVLSDPQLFRTHFEGSVKRRTNHFYGYIIEYIARLLAAGFLDQRFRSTLPDGRRAFASGQLKIVLFFLGNGWRFASNTAQQVERLLEQQIHGRLLDLLQGEKGAYADDVRQQLGASGVQIQLTAQPLSNHPSIPHPKAAVALGLLLDGGDQRRSEPRAGILGWNTHVNDKVLPWFLLYSLAGGGGPQPPDGATSTVISFGGLAQPPAAPPPAAHPPAVPAFAAASRELPPSSSAGPEHQWVATFAEVGPRKHQAEEQGASVDVQPSSGGFLLVIHRPSAAASAVEEKLVADFQQLGPLLASLNAQGVKHEVLPSPSGGFLVRMTRPAAGRSERVVVNSFGEALALVERAKAGGASADVKPEGSQFVVVITHAAATGPTTQHLERWDQVVKEQEKAAAQGFDLDVKPAAQGFDVTWKPRQAPVLSPPPVQAAPMPAPAPASAVVPSGRQWYERLQSESRVDWPVEEMTLPREFRQVGALDENLNMTRVKLRAQCRVENNWFAKGAFEVTLETLFRSKISETG